MAVTIRTTFNNLYMSAVLQKLLHHPTIKANETIKNSGQIIGT